MGENDKIPPPPSGQIVMPKVIPPPPSGEVVMPVQKKSEVEPTPEEKGVQSTNGSQTVSEQQSKSGAGVKTPTTYQWSSGSQQNYGITTPTEKEQRKVVSKNIVS